jgi:hypothetical protein
MAKKVDEVERMAMALFAQRQWDNPTWPYIEREWAKYHVSIQDSFRREAKRVLDLLKTNA